MLRAFLFDCDGVLVHSEPLHFRVFTRVLREEGIECSRETYDATYLGKDDHTCFVIALERAGRDRSGAAARALVERKAAYFAEGRHELAALPGVEAFVRRAAEYYPAAVASGALRRDIEPVLEQLGLRRCFQAVVSAEDCRRGKPDPEPFLTGMRRLSNGSAPPLRPEECLVVEDSLMGIAAARAAGMRCLAVATSFPLEQLGDADLAVPSLEGLDPVELATGCTYGG